MVLHAPVDMATDHSSYNIIDSLQMEEDKSFVKVKQPTILTNLQRGNVKQENPVLTYQRTIHEIAAQGELYNLDLRLIDTLDENLMTPLLWASGYGQNITVDYLIRNGANIHHRSNDGRTALVLAASKGYLHVAKILLRNGANPNASDDLNCTPLMYAAHDDHYLVVQELLGYGANLGVTNIHGQTAYSIALTRRSKAAQAVMESHLVVASRTQAGSLGRQCY